MNAFLLERARRLRVRCLAGFLFQVCLLAYVLVGWLGAGPWTLHVLAAAAGVNFLGYGLARFGPAATHSVVAVVAPAAGLVAWTALTLLGGGVGTSLFVVGFWFEILLSGVAASVAGVLFVTALSAACLFGLQLALGLDGRVGSLALQASFLLLVGGITASLRRSWEHRQERFSVQLDEQQRRLERIEAKLADAQALADLGAQAARMGHGLKNAVHSLRGFSTLIERSVPNDGRESAALKGLRQAIDQLEHLALETLEPRAGLTAAGDGDVAATPVNGHATTETGGTPLRTVVEDALHELSASFPHVRCDVEWNGGEARRVPRGVLTEVLGNLLRNGAESMAGEGTLHVAVHESGDGCELRIADEGPGIPPERRAELFRPGHTTKADGHGMGLYIARSLLEASGGALTLADEAPGAAFRVTLPPAWRA